MKREAKVDSLTVGNYPQSSVNRRSSIAVSPDAALAPKTGIDRRSFLRKLECTFVSAAFGSRAALPMLLAACGGVRYATASRVGAQLAIPVSDVGLNKAALVELSDGELPILVRRSAEGALSAVSTRCMHQGCQVEPGSDRLICPCHGSEYTFEGRVLKGPTELPLVRYRVTSDQSRIYIHLDSPLRETAGS